MNARGFKRVEGQHFDGTSLAALVTNDTSTRIMFSLMLMTGWTANLVDVKGVFLHGYFEDGVKFTWKSPKVLKSIMQQILSYYYYKRYTGLNRRQWHFGKNCYKS